MYDKHDAPVLLPDCLPTTCASNTKRGKQKGAMPTAVSRAPIDYVTKDQMVRMLGACLPIRGCLERDAVLWQCAVMMHNKLSEIRV